MTTRFDLKEAVRAAPDGGVVRIPPGTYLVNLVLERAITLMGTGDVVLDGGHQGPVIRIVAPGATVKLAGLLLVGGNADEAGGGVALLEGSLEAMQCTFRFNKAPLYGGGGLYVGGEQAVVRQCRFEGNTGRQGAAILVDLAASLVLEDSAVVQNAAVEGGGLRVKEGASATLLGCTLADNKVVGDAAAGGALHLSGTTTRAPTVSLSHCIVSERTAGPPLIFNDSPHPGALTLTRCLVPEWARATGEALLVGEPGFEGNEANPYFLSPKSSAVGAGDAAAFPAGAKDLMGRARISGGRAPDLGAYALVR